MTGIISHLIIDEAAAATAPPMPEALINAAVAANAAQQAANQTFMIGVVIVIILLIIGAAMIFVAYEFNELKRHTDGMRDDLVAATRKLALLEGNIQGRADHTAEEAKPEGKS